MRITVIVDIAHFNGRHDLYRKEVQVSGYEEAEDVLRQTAEDLRVKDVWEKKKEQEETE